MIVDKSNRNWEYTLGERYALKWFDENGFDVKKDGITDTFRLPQGDPKINYKDIMEQFRKSFGMFSKYMNSLD